MDWWGDRTMPLALGSFGLRYFLSGACHRGSGNVRGINTGRGRMGRLCGGSQVEQVRGGRQEVCVDGMGALGRA